MCFSATASFTSAALLASVGAATMAINPVKSHRMFVAMPILFGLQQAAEGIVWTTMGQESTAWLQRLGVIGFLGFALTVWPSWVPWSVFKMETNKTRRIALFLMGIAGLAVSATTLSFLYTSQPQAHIIGQCMGYSLTGITRNVPPNLDFLAYVFTVPLPFFVSSLREVKITGALIMIGLFLSHIINKEASTSVWCFFCGDGELLHCLECGLTK